MGRAPCCDKANVKRGPWSPEEDSKLKAYIQEFGTGGNWIALPQKIGLKRCGKSCRLRWLNYLRPNIKHGGFSEEEDNIICSLYMSIGSRWSIIAGQLAGRTDNDIKNYWNTKLKKKLLGKHRKGDQIRSRSTSSTSPTTKRKEDNNVLVVTAVADHHDHHHQAMINLYNIPLPAPHHLPHPVQQQAHHPSLTTNYSLLYMEDDDHDHQYHQSIGNISFISSSPYTSSTTTALYPYHHDHTTISCPEPEVQPCKSTTTDDHFITMQSPIGNNVYSYVPPMYDEYGASSTSTTPYFPVAVDQLDHPEMNFSSSMDDLDMAINRSTLTTSPESTTTTSWGDMMMMMTSSTTVMGYNHQICPETQGCYLQDQESSHFRIDAATNSCTTSTMII